MNRHRRARVGVVRSLAPFCLAAALAAACGGTSGSNAGKGDDSENGGSTASGGSDTTGQGGSPTGGSGASGSGRGGSGSGGSGALRCQELCDAIALCPEGADPYCVEDCEEFEDALGNTDCLDEYLSLVDCMFAQDVCGDAEVLCPSQVEATVACLTNDTGDDGCDQSETAPPTADCLALCEDSRVCDADPGYDCADECAILGAEVVEACCVSEYETYLDCVRTLPDLCSATGCETEAGALVTCMSL